MGCAFVPSESLPRRARFRRGEAGAVASWLDAAPSGRHLPAPPRVSVWTHAEHLAELEAPLPRGERRAVARLALAAAPFGAHARGPGAIGAAHRGRAARLPRHARHLPARHLPVLPLADRSGAPVLPGAHAGNPRAGGGHPT